MKKFYKLIWVVNGVVKETPMNNTTYPLCAWKRKQLKNSTHTTGELKIVPVT